MDDIKLAGKKQNIDPMWKVLNKEVDLGEPTSFLDHIPGMYSKTMWNKQRCCWQLQNHVWIQNLCRSQLKNYPCSENIRISSWSYDMEGQSKKCVERYCELANRTTQQLCKVSTPCIDDHHFKEEELKSEGDLSKVCFQIVLKCLYLARIGRPDILLSVNKLARSITKWIKDCAKRLYQLILKNSSHMWIQTVFLCGKHCQTMQTGTVSRLRFCRRSWGLKIYIRWKILRFLEVIHLFHSVGCVRNKLQFRTVQQNQKSFPWMQD